MFQNTIAFLLRIKIAYHRQKLCSREQTTKINRNTLSENANYHKHILVLRLYPFLGLQSKDVRYEAVFRTFRQDHGTWKWLPQAIDTWHFYHYKHWYPVTREASIFAVGGTGRIGHINSSRIHNLLHSFQWDVNFQSLIPRISIFRFIKKTKPCLFLWQITWADFSVTEFRLTFLKIQVHLHCFSGTKSPSGKLSFCQNLQYNLEWL